MRKIRYCIVCGSETKGLKYCDDCSLKAQKESLKNYRNKLKEKYGSSTGLWYQRNREKIRDKYRIKADIKRKEKGSFNCPVCGKLVNYYDDNIKTNMKTCGNDYCRKEYKRICVRKYYNMFKNTEKYRATHRKWWERYKEKMAQKGIIIKSRKKKND